MSSLYSIISVLMYNETMATKKPVNSSKTLKAAYKERTMPVSIRITRTLWTEFKDALSKEKLKPSQSKVVEFLILRFLDDLKKS